MATMRMNVGLISIALTLILGCSKSGETPRTTSSVPSVENKSFLLAEKPDNVQGVAEARKSAEGAKAVVVEGRVGGSPKPFVEGMAAFTIVDLAIPYCADDEGCPTPWDYCCNTDKMKDNSVLVKFVDADGTPVAEDAKKLLGIKELSRVVILGKAQRDETGNLVVVAEKLHLPQN